MCTAGSLKHFAVTSWPVFEANGVIHVWHHAEGEPPSWYPPTYEQIASGHYRYRGRTEHLVAAHVQVSHCWYRGCTHTAGTGTVQYR